MKIGYTSGTFDLFHVGHLNRILKAKEVCDFLIVGVSTDFCCSTYKKKPIIPFSERKKILEHIKEIDLVVPQKSLNKFNAWKKYHFNILIVGEDSDQRKNVLPFYDKLIQSGVEVFFHPRTKGISTSQIQQKILSNSGLISRSGR